MKVKLLLLTVFSVLVLSMLMMMPKNLTNLYVYGSPGDSYGNDIKFIEVWEGSTLKANFTTSGGSVSVNASKTITFNVSICLSSTLASSTSEAVSYTAVYMNITGIWTNVELNNTSVVLNGSFYYLIETGILNANTLTEGQTYACSVLYKAYY
jgi:hypothetical protein